MEKKFAFYIRGDENKKQYLTSWKKIIFSLHATEEKAKKNDDNNDLINQVPVAVVDINRNVIGARQSVNNQK